MSLAQLWVEFRASTDKFADDLAQIQRNVRDFDKELKPVTDRLKDLGNFASETGRLLTIGLTAPLAAVGALGLSFDAMFEQSQIAFTGLLGSAERADAFLQEMKSFAASTPFEFPDLLLASRRLLAMGFAANDIKPTLTAIGDAMAGLGAGPDVMERVVRAFGQIQTGGKVMTREMNELTMAGISAWEILAQGIPAAHGSTAALRKLVEEGLVPADQAIKVLTAGLEETFTAAMEKQSHTMNGLISNIKDFARYVSGDLAKGLFDALKGPLVALQDGMQGLATTLHSLPDSAKAAIAIFGVLAAAAGPVLFIFGQLILTLTSLATQFGRLFLFITGIAPTLADIGAAFGLIVEAFASGGFMAGISAFLELFGVLGAVAAGFATVGAAIAGLGLLELASRLLGVKDQFHGLLGDLLDLGIALAGFVGRVVTVSVKFVITEGEALWKWFMDSTAGKMAAGQVGNIIGGARSLVQGATNLLTPAAPSIPLGDLGTGASLGDYGPSADLIAQQKKVNEELQAARDKAAKEYESALKSLEKQLTKTNEEQRLLTDALFFAESQGMSTGTIMQVLGGKIKEVGKAFEEFGTPVNETVKAYIQLQKEFESSQRVMKSMDDEINREVDALHEVEVAAANAASSTERYNAVMNDLGRNAEGLRKYAELLDLIDRQQRDMNSGAAIFTGQAIPLAGFPLPIDFGPVPTAGARRAKTGGEILDEQQKRLKEIQADNERFAQSMATAMGDISRDFAGGLAEVIWPSDTSDKKKSQMSDLNSALSDYIKQFGETATIDKFKGAIIDSVRTFQGAGLAVTGTVADLYTKITGVDLANQNAIKGLSKAFGAMDENPLLNKMKGVFEKSGRAALEVFMLQLSSPLTRLMEHMGKTLADSATNLLSKGLGNALTSLLGGFGSKLGGLLGIGGSAAQSAASTAGGVAGAVGNAGSTAASAVSSAAGIGGSLISAAGGVIGGVISAIGSARQEGTLNAVEYNTRVSYLHLNEILHLVLEPWRTEFQEYKQLATYFLQYIAERMDPLIAAVSPALAPAGAAHLPAAGGAVQSGSTIIQGPQVTLNLNFSEKVDSQEIKTNVLPTIIDALNDNYNSYLEKLIQILNNSSGGVVTSRVTA